MKFREFKSDLQPRPRISPSEEEKLREWVKSRSRIALEIGSGNGEFAREYARLNPEVRLVAVEHTRTRAAAHKNISQSLHLAPLPNLLFIHANAIGLVSHFIPAEALESVFLLYPNPYPKKSDRHRRWFHLSFFPYLLTRLKPNGKLHLASNILEYLEDALSQSKHFPLKVDSRFDPETPRTAFERKYLSRGEPCVEWIFKKTDESSI